MRDGAACRSPGTAHHASATDVVRTAGVHGGLWQLRQRVVMVSPVVRSCSVQPGPSRPSARARVHGARVGDHAGLVADAELVRRGVRQDAVHRGRAGRTAASSGAVNARRPDHEGRGDGRDPTGGQRGVDDRVLGRSRNSRQKVRPLPCKPGTAVLSYRVSARSRLAGSGQGSAVGGRVVSGSHWRLRCAGCRAVPTAAPTAYPADDGSCGSVGKAGFAAGAGHLTAGHRGRGSSIGRRRLPGRRLQSAKGRCHGDGRADQADCARRER